MDHIGIDINCDVGEGIGNESSLMPYISSCNIACGAHAGDEATIRRVIRLAKISNVKVGAHPSYPDRENFGRKSMEIAPERLKESIARQLETFKKIADDENVELHHIKPHGALYNDISKQANLANVFLDAVSEYVDIPLYVPYRSKIEEEARNRNLAVHLEAFGDRNYHTDLRLVSRKESHAVIHHPSHVLHHLVEMIIHRKVNTIEGVKVDIEAETFCIHGDTPDALKILMYLDRELPNHNIRIKK